MINFPEATKQYKLEREQYEKILKIIEAERKDAYTKANAEFQKDTANAENAQKAVEKINELTKISQITKAWNAKKLAEQASDSHKDVRAKLADKEFETKNVTEHARLKTIVVAADGFKTAGDTAFKDTTPANKDTHYSTATAA